MQNKKPVMPDSIRHPCRHEVVVCWQGDANASESAEAIAFEAGVCRPRWMPDQVRHDTLEAARKLPGPGAPRHERKGAAGQCADVRTFNRKPAMTDAPLPGLESY